LKNARAKAEVSIDFPTESDAQAIASAMTPEMTAPRTTRASVRLTRRGKVTTIAFDARDLVALRAMVNSFLRFAATWRRVSKVLSPHHRTIKQARRAHRS
jgi:tRNA threonylcarbamoyladenosine modification (KEOPS) complex  Pcc1 subunit